MKPLTQAEARLYSPLALAFLGDSVYEVMAREYLLRKANQPAAKLHEQKVQLVCAPFQAVAAERLLPHLTEEEMRTIPFRAIRQPRTIIRLPDWKVCLVICT